ncbi:hypothetical protein [Parashewanella tropica]|uniref:hypothetical protein n=1 Tax=Parashewanella tropica TaxID=2547970 RepID=UPI001059B702|nr:hypothetical protein [Parashewanella tropica]
MELMLPELIVLGTLGLLFVAYTDVSANRKKLRLIERKLDMLLEKQGIAVNGEEFIPAEVQMALKNKQKIKAIRLYRQHTGASLLDAQKAVNDFIGNRV